MIDKIDGLKLLKKTATYIEQCDYIHCGTCQFFVQCKNVIDLALQFTAITNEKPIEALLP